MKCLQNVEFDDFVFLGCIYPRLTMDNTAVSAVGLMGAGKLRAGVRVRALMSYTRDCYEKDGVLWSWITENDTQDVPTTF